MRHGAESSGCSIYKIGRRHADILPGLGPPSFRPKRADLTAHALRAWNAWMPEMSGRESARMKRSITKALAT